MTSPTFFLSSLGCARNTVDSESMTGLLTQAGCRNVTDPEAADIIIVNTCSFIETAAQESIDTILSLARYKTSGVCRKLIVAGCLPQRYQNDISNALPEVDLFIGTAAYDQILAAINGNGPRCLLPDPDSRIFSSAPRFINQKPPHSAYLKIAEGCDRACTFCIIPRLRGRQKNRPLNEIVHEAEHLIAGGAMELVMVAQETTAYRCPQTSRAFSDLLETVAAIDRSVWVRMLYGHPSSLDRRTVETIAGTPNICSYFDIPVQHADDTVLKQMGRPYSRPDLVNLIQSVRNLAPEAVIRTTVMVGFPGETSTAFKNLLDFVETAGFDHLGAFIYSDADDLPAHRLAARPVPKRTAQKRMDTLMNRQMHISATRNRRHIGKSRRVLVDAVAEPGIYLGRTEFQAPEVDGLVFIHATTLSPGVFADVMIEDALEYDLIGRLA